MKGATVIALEQLSLARRVADYADRLGARQLQLAQRAVSEHLGAVLADAILQAGLNYRTVVRARIERIEAQFPDTATLSGVLALIEREQASDFLLWKHPAKVTRFVSLAKLLAVHGIETTAELKSWLCVNGAREQLLGLHGIGPKTFDYLCCLVGIDCVAIDRHVMTFASEAGVIIGDYDYLKSVVSCAADLLGLRRRDFDAWIWQTVTARA